MKTHSKNSLRKFLVSLTGLVLALLCLVVLQTTPSRAIDNAAQQTFASPQEAGSALETAARTNNDAALAQILGPEAKAVLSSGDAAEDRDALASFVSKYEQMNRWVPMTDGSQVLYIGADNYPYPIPLKQDASSRWYFNTAAGKQEVLARRIGHNELLAIDAVYAMANAEQLYWEQGHDGKPAHLYTSKVLSSPGKQDGLYWQVPAEQPSSPLGRLDEFAADVLASTQPGATPVFDGYSFRITLAQAGSKGFTIVATPVSYGHSGIMTFVLGKDGKVHQKNLGPKTASLTASISSISPGQGWAPAE